MATAGHNSTNQTYQCPTRIMLEIDSLANSFDECGVDAVPSEDGLMGSLIGRIRGPVDTPFASGIFHVKIDLPANYPFEPPSIRFKTHVFHPNISSSSGAICVDFLKDKWSPVLFLKAILLSLQVLLGQANDSDPQDAIVARIKRNDLNMYNHTARYWTTVFAGGSAEKHPVYAEQVKSLTDLGIYDEERVIKHLSWNAWDANVVAKIILAENKKSDE